MTDIKRYTYRISWSEDDEEYVGTCEEFPSLSHLDKDPRCALEGIIYLVGDVLSITDYDPVAHRNADERYGPLQDKR